MKKLILITFAVFCYLNVFSQLEEPWTEKTIKNVFDQSEFIFEGKVIKSQSYKVGTSGIYTSNIIQISKIIKGGDKIKKGTIDIIAEGGSVGLEVVQLGERRSNYGVGGEGMFFCSKSKYPSSNIVIVDNIIRVQVLEIVGFYMENLHERNADPSKRKVIAYGFSAFDKIFTSKNEFYQFLSTYPNITIPKDTTIEK